jgi:hypothetical protein
MDYQTSILVQTQHHFSQYFPFLNETGSTVRIQVSLKTWIAFISLQRFTILLMFSEALLLFNFTVMMNVSLT